MNKWVSIALILMVALAGCGELTEEAKEENSTIVTTEAVIEEVTEAVADDTEEIEETATEAVTEEPQEIKVLEVGDTAPDFTAQLVNGETVKLSDYNDKIVLLNFWATWCPPCVNEMPAFERLKNDGDDDLVILCINCMEDKATVDQFVKDNGYTFNIGYDEEGSIEMYYPTDGIPYTLVINKGEVADIYIGAADADTQYSEYKNAIEQCKK